MKKSIFAALALLSLTGCATRLPEEELRLTRERLDKYLFNEENLTQSEMTIMSEYLLRLARMEQYMIEYRIWNQPGYENIEKQFMADCERWNKKLEEEAQKPSEYAGGSMEPMDRNLRMTDLVRKRIDELKTKWLAKP
ncbi:MAG: membrane lipoprotein lipid attachment site-containing protein [Lentisphaeria bacterium]|nr:membrane lipoprotein lipid attachment site-containing protein [Lentisphaeria bacterium]